MSKAALREQRRAQRIAKRNQQRMIIGVIVFLIVVLIAYFVYKDYKNRLQTATPTPAAGTNPTGGLYPIGTLDTTPPAPSANAVTTASGLIYEDLQVGDGAIAKSGDSVSVNYTLWLANGTKVQSSLDGGQPLDFVLGNVIAGWNEGVPGMRVNGTRLLIIPPALGYGSTGQGSTIPPNATLTFEVQLVAIK